MYLWKHKRQREPKVRQARIPAIRRAQEQSPIEQLFWDAYNRLKPPALRGLVPQYRVGQYRIDFAIPKLMIGIELDGQATHSTTRAIAADRQRQRTLEFNGWYIIRFGGAEVFADPERCVREAAAMVSQRARRSR